jgi:hypothetical protein
MGSCFPNMRQNHSAPLISSYTLSGIMCLFFFDLYLIGYKRCRVDRGRTCIFLAPNQAPNHSGHYSMHAPFHSPRTYTVPTRSRVDRTRTCNNPRSKRGNLASGSLLYIKTSRVKRTRTSNNLHSKWSNLASGSPPYK